jgi:hypothetical protein
MNRETIIKEFTDNIKDFQKLALNIAGEQDCEDLMQLCTLELLEMSEARLIAAYNPTQGLKPFFIRVLCLQYRSKTSKYHKYYRKDGQFLIKNFDDITLNTPQSIDEYEPGYFDKIENICQGLYNDAGSNELAQLEKTIWEAYVQKGSLRKTLDAIPPQYADILDLKAVHTIIKKFRRTLKAGLNVED